MINQPLKTAVLIGGHTFDVPGFRALLDSLPDVDYYLQDLENFAADSGKVRAQYETILFYNMPRHVPDPGNRGDLRVIGALESVVEAGQGIVVLHHAVLAFAEWSWWADLVDIADRSFGYDHDQSIPVTVANPNHPITSGIADWEILDETYSMDGAGADSEVLLTTEHPRSMPTLAWTRQFHKSRVFCYQGGHDNHAFADPTFRTILGRGLQWTAGRL
jgi:hypothetical protein